MNCDCGEAATHKVAARWSDGVTVELKTYGLCCAACLPGALQSAAARWVGCRLTHGETLGPPAALERTAPGGAKRPPE